MRRNQPISLRAASRMLVSGPLALAGVLALAGCGGTRPQVFTSPDLAVDAMMGALRPEVDRERLVKVFGSEIDEVLPTGRDADDQNDLITFLERYDRGHRIVEAQDGSRVLEIDTDNWPFAFPIVQTDGGWKFDTAAGVDELLNRRIGGNELDTIQTCLAVVDAQHEYAAVDRDGDRLREYAPAFASAPGTHNGLYWPTESGSPPSPMGEFLAAAEATGYRPGDAFNGYYFRLLAEQGPGAPGGAMDYRAGDNWLGGFGLLAWPAEYGDSGIKTFMTNTDGVIYEIDLGESTARRARDIRAFDPTGWTQVATDATGQ